MSKTSTESNVSNDVNRFSVAHCCQQWAICLDHFWFSKWAEKKSAVGRLVQQNGKIASAGSQYMFFERNFECSLATDQDMDTPTQLFPQSSPQPIITYNRHQDQIIAHNFHYIW